MIRLEDSIINKGSDCMPCCYLFISSHYLVSARMAVVYDNCKDEESALLTCENFSSLMAKRWCLYRRVSLYHGNRHDTDEEKYTPKNRNSQSHCIWISIQLEKSYLDAYYIDKYEVTNEEYKNFLGFLWI